MDLLILADGNIHKDQLVVVGFGEAEGVLHGGDKLAEATEGDVLRGLLVELLPRLVVHVKVFLSEALLHVLGRLAEVLQDHSDVHVDDDQEADDEIRHHEDDGLRRVAAVAYRLFDCVVRVAVLVVHDAGQGAIPARRCRDLEQQDHAASKRLEIEHVVQAARVLHVHEEVHAKDGEDEHNEKEQ